ncbi:MAG: hypothetical protein Q9219_005586 [cf. Caloplaca sp. 3 TL-2023]
MGKRKTFDDSAAEQDSEEDISLSESSSDEDEYDEIRQEFEFFDPQSPWDFEGFKRLLRQLFDADATSFHLGAIADLILAQPLLGSTIKTEGNESDPHAFLTILSLEEHRDKRVIKDLTNYIQNRAGTNPELSPLQALLNPDSGAKVGLILTERWVNIATELIPPMYQMLLEEISWAIADQEPYTFSHYLIVSKTYLAIPSLLDEKTNRPKKKMKPKVKQGLDEGKSMYYFHPEDEVLERHAALFGSFDYIKQNAESESDSKSTFHDFGIKQRGHLILIEGAKFKAAIKEMGAEFSTRPPAPDATMDDL